MNEKTQYDLRLVANAIRHYAHDPVFMKQVFATIASNTDDRQIQELMIDAFMMLDETSPELPEDMK